MSLMERIGQRLAESAGTKWCAFRRGGRPCDHGAVTYLVAEASGCESGFACEDHRAQMAGHGWRDAAG